MGGKMTRCNRGIESCLEAIEVYRVIRGCLELLEVYRVIRVI